jgi:hypothetical protein
VAQLHPCDRSVTEEAVYPLNDLGDDLLDERGMCGDNHQLEDAFGFFARGKPDCLGAAHPGVGRADDLGPAGDHRGLHEAEAAESGATNIGHEIADRARPLPAWALVGPGCALAACRFVACGRRFVAASHDRASHAIGRA